MRGSQGGGRQGGGGAQRLAPGAGVPDGARAVAVACAAFACTGREAAVVLLGVGAALRASLRADRGCVAASVPVRSGSGRDRVGSVCLSSRTCASWICALRARGCLAQLICARPPDGRNSASMSALETSSLTGDGAAGRLMPPYTTIDISFIGATMPAESGLVLRRFKFAEHGRIEDKRNRPTLTQAC